jgi:hypothetical protein
LRSTFERFAGGTGTSTNPFQITDIYGLQGLASTSNFFYATTTNDEADYSFILENNIDASVARTGETGQDFCRSATAANRLELEERSTETTIRSAA